ncbi:MAG: CARDB domain-containing protein [Cyanobacteria bacterium J06636_27]
MQIKSLISSVFLLGTVALPLVLNTNKAVAQPSNVLPPPVVTDKAPDLIIQRVKETGNRARIVIKNQGSKASTPCVLSVYGGTSFDKIRSRKIPAIPVGGTRTVIVRGAAKSPSLYFIDANNSVAELVESNNVAFVP